MPCRPWPRANGLRLRPPHQDPQEPGRGPAADGGRRLRHYGCQGGRKRWCSFATASPSVTLAQPQMIATKVDRLMAAAKSHACEVRWIVDSRPGLELLAGRAEAHRLVTGVFH